MLRSLIGKHLPDPIPPFSADAGYGAFEHNEFLTWGFRKRVAAMARAWAVQGNAMPLPLSLMYLVKACAYLAFFHAYVRHFDSPEADFVRFILYTMTFERALLWPPGGLTQSRRHGIRLRRWAVVG